MSIFFKTSSMNSINWVSHDFNLRNPWWRGKMMLYVFACIVILLTTMCSSSLQQIQVREIWFKLDEKYESSNFRIQLMLDPFNCIYKYLWNHKRRGAVLVVIVWYLDLQLPMQSVPITTDIASLNLDQDEVYNIMWWSLSVTGDRSVVFSGSSGFTHQ